MEISLTSLAIDAVVAAAEGACAGRSSVDPSVCAQSRGLLVRFFEIMLFNSPHILLIQDLRQPQRLEVILVE